MTTYQQTATKTKIIATLGPASWDIENISALIEAGADCFRINCSHADHDGIRSQIARVRRVAIQKAVPIALLLDLQGPKIRVGPVDGSVVLEKGDTLTIVMDSSLVGSKHTVGTTFTKLADDVQIGDIVLFSDGLLSGSVSAIDLTATPATISIMMEVGGELTSNKGINLPGVEFSVPALTKKDREDLKIGVSCGVDYVALSFVRKASDLIDLRLQLKEHGVTPLVIAKIEKPQAVDALDEILELADGVMVARGDLGVEVPLEQVPMLQKHIIAVASSRGKLVITATQMLDSMERNPRPTRAETTDVANAILDGTDAIMLSGETAIGHYPVLTVSTMDRIASETERSRFFLSENMSIIESGNLEETVVRAAVYATKHGERPMIVYTWTGTSALQVSKARVTGTVFALTPFDHILDRLSLMWGITPIKVPMMRTTDELLAAGEKVLTDLGLVKEGQEVVSLAGKLPMVGATNIMKVHQIGEL